MRHRLLVITLALAWPHLPGAGCRAHHAAPVSADVVGAGAPVVLYFSRGGDCGPTGADCIDRPELWRPLRRCEVSDESQPAAAAIVRVSGCTSYIGVDYAIDIMAIDDGNGNGRLDPGERYGMWAGNPLRREREAKVGTITLEISQTR